METLLVKLKHEKARKLLQDLEDLEILEVKEAYNDKKSKASKISDIKNKVTVRMSEKAINQQLLEYVMKGNPIFDRHKCCNQIY